MLLKSEKVLGIVLVYILIPALTILLFSTITARLPVQDKAVTDINSGWEYFNQTSGKPGRTDLPAFISIPKKTTLRLVKNIQGLT